ncbi:MAG: hypothetical protein ACRD2T_15280 [Thermoanaerobaculia bacterium]
MTQSAQSVSWLRWTVLTTVGLAAGLVAALAAGGPVEAVVGMLLAMPVVTGIVGLVLGGTQWLELRRRVRPAGRWIAASAVGLSIGLLGGVAIVEQIGRAVTGGQVSLRTMGSGWVIASFAVVGVVSGLLLGLMQWLAFRRFGLPGAFWVATSTLAMSAALFAGALVAETVTRGVMTPGGFALFALLAGAILGAISGRRLRSV